MLLIDGNHLASRHRYTNSELVTSSGNRSGVIFGFLRSLSWIKNHLKIPFEQTIVCWDGGRCEKREEAYPLYKAHRTTDEDRTEDEKLEFLEYLDQMRQLGNALEFIGVHQIRVKKVEADDVISLIANHFSKHGHFTTVFSGDKDFHQLASEKISIFGSKDSLLGRLEICDLWKVKHPRDIVFLRALAGDGSDNIAGLAGIGEVRALKLAKYIAYSNGRLIMTGYPEKGLLKYVDLAFSNTNVIRRNMFIMRLPLEFTTDLYSQEQVGEIIEQLIAHKNVLWNKDLAQFIKFLNAWELHSIVEEIAQW